MDRQNHDARHLYATALLHAGQTYSAVHLVDVPQDVRCSGCLDLKAKCCIALGRHRQARQALEDTLQDAMYTAAGKSLPSDVPMMPVHVCPASTSSRPPRIPPDESALHCRAGMAALKGNLTEKASVSFRQALTLNPLLWEAFEGLCTVGSSHLVSIAYALAHSSDQVPFQRLINCFRLVHRP
jgi:anaphase-promoting complex subunit 3